MSAWAVKTRRRMPDSMSASRGGRPNRTGHPGRMRQLGGGALYVAAPLVYGVAQLVTAAAWHPAYDWRTRYISDLGNTACGPFAVPHGSPAFVCSPLHAFMNTSFVLSGTVLLWDFWPHQGLVTAALGAWLVSGAGKMGIGVVPENVRFVVHTLFACNVPLGSIGALLLSMAELGRSGILAASGLGAAGVSLVGTVLSAAAPRAGPALLFGFGAGGMERVASYPPMLWLVVAGCVAVRDAPRADPRDASLKRAPTLGPSRTTS